MPPPYASHYGVVPEAPPEEGLFIPADARGYERAVHAIATVDTLATQTNSYLVSRLLTARESVASSALEGTHSTIDELLTIEATGESERRAEALQVRDHARVLSDMIPQARARGHGVFTADLVRRVHAALMRADADYKDTPGDLRSSVVWIGSGHIARSTWTPPPPEAVPAALEDTLDYMRNEGLQQRQGIIVRMAVAHAHFEAVHPFRDGNGRVGRLLLPLMMAAEGHTPL